MAQYDAIIILGSRPTNPASWAFPSHIYHALDRAVELIKQSHAQYVIVSGKWTINFDVLHIQQPFLECNAMADYLAERGVAEAKILRETESKDTISNFYYIKRAILKKYPQIRTLHFIAAEPRLERIAFLCQRILGPDYNCSFEGVAYKEGEVSPNEARTMRVQGEFLAPMQDGEDSWLDGKFFGDPFYDTVRARVIERAANEPFLPLANPKWQPET